MPEQKGMKIVPSTVPSTPLDDSTSRRQITRKLASRKRQRQNAGAVVPRLEMAEWIVFTVVP
jgi:hypothetical protein